MGVGLLEGLGGVNWGFFGKTFASWVSTLLICAGATAALFAQVGRGGQGRAGQGAAGGAAALRRLRGFAFVLPHLGALGGGGLWMWGCPPARL